MKTFFIAGFTALLFFESYSFYSLRRLVKSDERFAWSLEWCGYDPDTLVDRDCRSIALFRGDSLCGKVLASLQDEWKPRLKCERK